jgi:hypothetical protein
MPESSSFPIFLRATMPQVQSPDTGEGSGCGRFRVYLATRCECSNARRTCRSAVGRPGRRRRPGADVRAAREAGGSRRTGRRGGIRPVHWQQQLWVDAITSHGGCTVNGDRRGQGGLDGKRAAPAIADGHPMILLYGNPTARVSGFFYALRCPRFNRRTPARGQGAGGLE